MKNSENERRQKTRLWSGTETEVPASYLGSRYNEYSYDSWRRPFDHAAEGYLDKTIGIVRETTVSGEFRERTLEEKSRLIGGPIEVIGKIFEHSHAGKVLGTAASVITVYQEYHAASSPSDFEIGLFKAGATGYAAGEVAALTFVLTGMMVPAIVAFVITPIAIDLTASAFQILHAHAERELSELAVHLNREIYQLYHVPMF